MILGRKTKDLREWHKVFVIWPRKLTDGRWALLEWVLRCEYLAGHIGYDVPFDMFGWCYKELPKE